MAEEQEPSARAQRTLGKLQAKAAKIVNDHEALKKLLSQATEKLENAGKDDSLMQKMVAYIRLILRMLTNYLNGTYNETPWQTLIMLIAGLLYFVMPLDAIPDFIPIAGWIDDATVLVWLGRCFREDLAHYKKWESLNYSE